MSTWDIMLELGRSLERLGQVEREVRGIKRDVKAIRSEIDGVKTWGTRALLVLALWATTAGVGLGQDELAEKIAQVLKIASMLL